LRGVAHVFGEGRSVPVRDGVIRERFGPLEAIVFVVGP
jgi:hypothetical protein